MLDKPVQLRAGCQDFSQCSIEHCEQSLSHSVTMMFSGDEQQGRLHVLPVSRQATLAHVSWLSTSHFFKLSMTRLRSRNEVAFHCFCASAARAILRVISSELSAITVSRWNPVAGSKQVIHRLSPENAGGLISG